MFNNKILYFYYRLNCATTRYQKRGRQGVGPLLGYLFRHNVHTLLK